MGIYRLVPKPGPRPRPGPGPGPGPGLRKVDGCPITGSQKSGKKWGQDPEFPYSWPLEGQLEREGSLRSSANAMTPRPFHELFLARSRALLCFGLWLILWVCVCVCVGVGIL